MSPYSGRRTKPVIALTTGDPNGIGPEVVLKSISNAVVTDEIIPVLVGLPEVWQATAEILGLNPRVDGSRLYGTGLEAELSSPSNAHQQFKASPGNLSSVAGTVSMQAVAHAVDLCVAGSVDGMVTAPISKEAIGLGGYSVPGHTEFIKDRVGNERVLMLMVSDRLRVGVATGHIPVSQIPDALTLDVIIQKALVLLDSLERDFGCPSPRLAMLGLNPHAGDGGVLGTEEDAIIRPAINQLQSMGHQVDGPFPADGFFGNKQYNDFDGVMAMYHDQGLVPFKTLSFNNGVNFSAGLSIVRTSPDHGTAFDIAGKGIASQKSMMKAITTAVSIIHSRRNFSDVK